MNYYYNLTINNNLSKFYEWTLEDNLIQIKKIPVFRLNENLLLNLIKYDGKVDSNFLKKIYNKTTYQEEGKIKAISYMSLFTDTKFCLATTFDKEGNIVNRSYLLLEDELNVLEIGFSLKKEKLLFNKSSKITINNDFKQEVLMKETIKKEINKLYQSKDNNKLIYYYLEWFNDYVDNIKEIYQKMCDELEKDSIFNLEKIYDLIIMVNKQLNVK